MRDFLIEIVISENPNGSHVMSIGNRHRIVIDPKQAAGIGNPKVILAHELGHVIGMEFGEDYHMRDAAIQYAPPEQRVREIADGVELRKEEEAWDTAEEILKVRNFCLDSYKRLQQDATQQVMSKRMFT